MSVVEMWRPVISYGGRYPGYSASSLGRIRRDADGHIMSQSLAGRDRHYLYVALRERPGKQPQPRPVALLVAEAFMGLRKPGQQVNHINGIRTDNRIENFEYVTHHENHLHAGRLGLKAWGERHAMARLTEAQVRQIKAIGYTQTAKEIGARYGVGKGCIDSIRLGHTWRHLDEPGLVSSAVTTASTQSGRSE